MQRVSGRRLRKAYTDEDGMAIEEFRECGEQIIDLIRDYKEHINLLKARSDKKPFYLQPLMPDHAPEKPEDWDTIMADFEDYILPGVNHVNHPCCFSYTPAANSYPAILGDMLSSSIACHNFSWFSSPAATELEMVALDWYAKAINLPKTFFHSFTRSKGGGCIQGSPSECIFISLIAARHQAIKALMVDKKKDEIVESCKILSKLVAYTSKESCPSIEKAAKLSYVRLRLLNVDKNNCLRGDILKKAIEADIREGFVPFYVAATLGTTTVCSFDNVKEIAQVCSDYSLIWLHVDAAYAGNAFICPEFRYLMSGIEYARSINVCPSTWFLVNFDCSCLWVQNYQHLIESLAVNKLYLQDDWEDETVEFRQWGIPLSRRFRALKLWLVLRCYGINGIQYHIKRHCHLAKLFESYIKKDKRFILMNDCLMGVVCFRVAQLDDYESVTEDQLTQLLLALINVSGKVSGTPVYVQSFFSIRLCICYDSVTEEQIANAWTAISNCLAILETYFTERAQFSMRKPLSYKEQIEYLDFLRSNSSTRSIPQSEYRRLAYGAKLNDFYSPIYVPESDDDLAEKIDLGKLLKRGGRFSI
ncbi:tyrosine decarboxylase-like [Schistocerca cancellata]|uniref:tyrosine decarboxylase-like n=1 Tax=Schistocerca cancellata TaxID=274614 RepID=UPI0021191304|nr:tyrosine decarboxylase-like [Schistocerca cancellata]